MFVFAPLIAMWRLADKPPLKLWWRSTPKHEILLAPALTLLLGAALVVPWIATNAVYWSVISFVALSLIIVVGGIFVAVRDLKRDLAPRGTYWDPSTKQFRRERKLNGADIVHH